MQIKTSTALAIFAIVMTIALVTAGSSATSTFAAKTKTKKHTSTRGTSIGSTSTLGTTGKGGTSSTSTGLSKFISCVRALPTLTRADAINCYNTVYSPGFSSAGSTAGTRSEEHTSELQSHSFISYAVF